MSEACKMSSLPIEVLKPHWVEFTGTKGVLRVLKPNEETKRARGLIFKCPRCRHSRQKDHYCIFLFLSSPEHARPHGRFLPTLDDMGCLVGFPKQTLHALDDAGGIRGLLKPGDLPCLWEGFLFEGKVSWRPSLMERLRRA